MNRLLKLLCVYTTWGCLLQNALAQHSDVLLQSVEDRLTSGSADFDSGQWTLGARVYAQQFDSDYAITDPGWNALGEGSPSMPAGAAALPSETDLKWDFVPMKIDGLAAGLFYWDGIGEVQFGSLPGPDYYLSLQSLEMGASTFFDATSDDNLVPGAVLDTTSSLGALHRHRFFFLDDGDGDFDTDPLAGVYLVSVRPRMAGLDRSHPLYFVFGTLDSTQQSILEAQQWATQFENELAPDFSADFDGDLVVDTNDLATWQSGYGTTGTAALQITGDADFNDDVSGQDFLTWQRQAGSSITTFAGATSGSLSTGVAHQVPEPSTLGYLASAFAAYLEQRRK